MWALFGNLLDKRGTVIFIEAHYDDSIKPLSPVSSSGNESATSPIKRVSGVMVNSTLI